MRRQDRDRPERHAVGDDDPHDRRGQGRDLDVGQHGRGDDAIMRTLQRNRTAFGEGPLMARRIPIESQLGTAKGAVV